MNINTGSLIILDCVDSTNNYAMQQVNCGKARHGDAWFALEQTNGKGRRGKHWEAKKGENIILSVVVNSCFLAVYKQFQLSVASSLACYDLLNKYASTEIKIKWPNDIFWNDMKAGGILIENVIKGDIWRWAVIGIGININQSSFSIVNNRAVSLKQITGKLHDPVELGRKLYSYLITRLEELKNGNFERMLSEYNNVLYKRNEKVKLKLKNIIFETTITGVSFHGQLQTVDSMEHNFNFDEIEWIL